MIDDFDDLVDMDSQLFNTELEKFNLGGRKTENYDSKDFPHLT